MIPVSLVVSAQFCENNIVRIENPNAEILKGTREDAYQSTFIIFRKESYGNRIDV